MGWSGKVSLDEKQRLNEDGVGGSHMDNWEKGVFEEAGNAGAKALRWECARHVYVTVRRLM